MNVSPLRASECDRRGIYLLPLMRCTCASRDRENRVLMTRGRGRGRWCDGLSVSALWWSSLQPLQCFLFPLFKCPTFVRSARARAQKTPLVDRCVICFPFFLPLLPSCPRGAPARPFFSFLRMGPFSFSFRRFAEWCGGSITVPVQRDGGGVCCNL